MSELYDRFTTDRILREAIPSPAIPGDLGNTRRRVLLSDKTSLEHRVVRQFVLDESDVPMLEAVLAYLRGAATAAEAKQMGANAYMVGLLDVLHAAKGRTAGKRPGKELKRALGRKLAKKRGLA